MDKIFNIIGIGEILWDVFPKGKKLGGAPANFAYHISALGHNGIVVSRVGSDELGQEIIDYLIKLNFIKDYIQVDKDKPTGVVEVKIDNENQPNYIIKEDVAWDFLSWNEEFSNLVKSVDAICFGTLAQRNEVSRETILNFLREINNNAVKIMDVNLRQNFYNKTIIEESLRFTNILKLNIDELRILSDLLKINKKYGEKNLCRAIISNYEVELICLTKGEDGSMLIDKNSSYESQTYPYEVADRVGAGDSFTAAMIVYYLKGDSMHAISKYANKLASWVTSKPEGMPAYNYDVRRIMSS